MTAWSKASHWMLCGMAMAIATAGAQAQPSPKAETAQSVDLPPSDSPAAMALLASEDVRFRAEASGDTATLDRLMAKDLVYSHFTGMRQGKSAVIQMFTRMHFLSITPSQRYARVLGEVGFVRGKVVRQLAGHALTDGYIAMYVHRDGRWQLLEWASTAAPQP